MTKKRTTRGPLPSRGSTRKSPALTAEERAARDAPPDLDSARWNVGAIAWSPEGHIVILDPLLRDKLVRLARSKRKKDIVIGLPPKGGAGVGPRKKPLEYDPFPLGGPKPKPIPIMNELCVCDGALLRFGKLFMGSPKRKAHPARGR